MKHWTGQRTKTTSQFLALLTKNECRSSEFSSASICALIIRVLFSIDMRICRQVCFFIASICSLIVRSFLHRYMHRLSGTFLHRYVHWSSELFYASICALIVRIIFCIDMCIDCQGSFLRRYVHRSLEFFSVSICAITREGLHKLNLPRSCILWKNCLINCEPFVN
jgi:hypothetical protein